MAERQKMWNRDPTELRDAVSNRVVDHDYTKGPLLLLAGPGTGKTYSLLETIKTRLKKGLDYFDFFEATLTNAAVDDFISDAKEQITPEFKSSSTLHSRAKGILHLYAALLGLDPNFTVIDGKCQTLILRDMCYMFGSCVDKELEEYEEASAKCLPIKSDFSRVYQKIQFFYAAIDWFDVVRLACQLLGKHQEVRDKECGKFRFLLIDEYQDLNPADQEFVQLLLNGRTNLLVVGDDDQSIYSHRYADPEGIVTLDNRYSNISKEVLPVSSRLPSEVINASYSLISKNRIRKPKERLIALSDTEQRADGGFVISVNLKSAKAEQQFIGEAIIGLLNQQISPNQILVLCNCRTLGIELVSVLQDSRYRIPIQSNLEKAQGTNERKLLLECIRKFMFNQEDNLSLRMILDKLIGTHCNDSSFLVRYALQKGISLWQTIKTERITAQLENTGSIINEFVGAIQKAIQFDDCKDRLNCILCEVCSLSDLLRLIKDEYELSDGVGDRKDLKENKDRVRFMTLHNSKGLDADFIFIPFMEDSIGLPAVDTEEKRRLLYVAITRAKVGVIFSWAWSRHTDKRFKCSGSGGSTTKRKPSPFIAECGVSPNLRFPDADPSSSRVAIEILLKYAVHVCSFSES